MGMIWGIFWKKYRRILGYLCLFLLPLGALFIDEVRFPKTMIVQGINSWIVHPIIESIDHSIGGVTYIFKNYVALRKVKETNDELQKEVAKLKLDIIQYKEIAQENERLQHVLNLKKNVGGEAHAAQVIGEDTSPDRFTYLINIGAKDGIEIRGPVLTPDGIVGVIKEVYDHTALVVTILDPSNIVDAVDVRSRSHALLEGTGHDYVVRTKFVDRVEDFHVGDSLLSSGLDGIFPKGYPLGTIVQVDKPALGVLQASYVRPAVDYDKLEEVLVLPPMKRDATVQISNDSKVKGNAR